MKSETIKDDKRREKDDDKYDELRNGGKSFNFERPSIVK